MSAPVGSSQRSLFTPEELERLTERARLDVQGAVTGAPVVPMFMHGTSEEREMVERDHARLVRGLAGLRVAARCHALARDPAGLRPIVWGTWAIHAERGFDTHEDAEDRIATAVQSVGPRVLEVPGLAERLARSELRLVRLALALALPEGCEPILRALAQDDDAEVRRAAQEKIGSIDRWGGAFPIPPRDHPDEVLEPARAVLDMSAYQRAKAPDDVVRAFAPLADALAVACWERVLSAEGVNRDALRPWLACLLERPGGGAALGRLVTLWEIHGFAAVTSGFLDLARERMPDAARARVFAELVSAVREHEEAEREGRAPRYLRAYLVDHAVAIAPEQGDARRILEAILGAPIDAAAGEPGGYDYAISKLTPLLLACYPLDDALRATLVEARRAGKPGRWARVDDEVWNALGADPVLREKAWRDLEDASRSVRGEAVRALLGPQHDSVDGTVAELARRFYARPELRAAVLGAHKELLPEAREDLVRGDLDVGAAAVVLLGTRDQQTDAMWAAARAVRDRAVADPTSDAWASQTCIFGLVRELEEGPDPADFEYLRALAERALTLDECGNLRFVAERLERMGTVESAALLREVDERASDELRAEIARGVAYARGP